MLIGEYYYQPYPKDIIIIDPNHTYVHMYTATDGTVFKCDGKWKFDSIGVNILP